MTDGNGYNNDMKILTTGRYYDGNGFANDYNYGKS